MSVLLDKYRSLLDFLSLFLGDNTEVVLQDFTKGFDNSVVYIKNNLSGRAVGAPATDFVLDVYESGIYKEKDYMINYKTRSIHGLNLYSSSFFIKDEKKNLLGMICLNSDKSDLLLMRKILDKSLANINKNLSFHDTGENIDNDEDIIERFYESSEKMIDAVIFDISNLTTTDNLHKLKKDDKLDIVESLYKKGFFHLKDAVSKLANTFQMSDVSIYKYIQEVKKNLEK